MNSTPTPKAIEPHNALIARADEQLAHTYEQIARADGELARLSEQLAKIERAARPPSAGPGPQLPAGGPALRTVVSQLERDAARRRPSAGPGPQLPPRRPALRALVGLPRRRASLSLPWSCSRPMAAGPSRLSPVGRRSSFQLHHRRRKMRRFPRSPLHPSLKRPRRRQHHRKQRPWLRPHRKTPHRQLPQRFPITHSCCKRWRAISRIWSETSNSSRRTSNK